LRIFRGLVCLLLACLASPVPAGEGAGDAALERLFPRAPALRCPAKSAADADLTLVFADCGMGRHCPDDTRCCVSDAGFWCCPKGTQCDYDQPNNCRARH